MTDVSIAITTGVGADNQVQSTSATYNKGIEINFSLIATARRYKCRFDLSGIPAGNVAIAATLKLYHANTNGINNTYGVYKISDANGNWIEGTQNSALALSGEPCWNAKAANGSGGVTTAWAGSAGLMTAVTDYINTVIASASTGGSITANAALDFTFNADGLAVLSSWFGQATNNGMLIFPTAATTTGGFHSKEAATAGYRPTLDITYVPASGHPAVNRMSLIKFANGYKGV